MPLPCNIPRPELIHRPVAAIEIRSRLSSVFSFSVALEIVSAHTDGPDSGPAKEGDCKAQSAQEIKCSEPKRPIRHIMEHGPEWVAKGPVFSVLIIGVEMYACVVHQGAEPAVVLGRKRRIDHLMIGIGKKTVPPSAIDVIGVSGLFGILMVHMMGDDIDLFGDDLDDEVSQDKTPDRAFDLKCPVGAIAMQPERPMTAHENHAVDEPGQGEAPRKIVSKKEGQWYGQAQTQAPSQKRQPVLF